MDISINERLRLFLKTKNIKYDVFRKKLGIGRLQQISNWMNLKEKVPEKYLRETVIQYKEINARWLLTGEGAMMNEQQELMSVFVAGEMEIGKLRNYCRLDLKDMTIIMEDLEQCIKIMQRASKIIQNNLIEEKTDFQSENVITDVSKIADTLNEC